MFASGSIILLSAREVKCSTWVIWHMSWSHHSACGYNGRHCGGTSICIMMSNYMLLCFKYSVTYSIVSVYVHHTNRDSITLATWFKRSNYKCDGNYSLRKLSFTQWRMSECSNKTSLNSFTAVLKIGKSSNSMSRMFWAASNCSSKVKDTGPAM